MAIGGMNQSANSRSNMLRTRRETLQAEVAELSNQLGDVDAQAIVQYHIEKLHAYNEIKDGVQALIGQYALMTGTTVKEVHERLDLSLTE